MGSCQISKCLQRINVLWGPQPGCGQMGSSRNPTVLCPSYQVPSRHFPSSFTRVSPRRLLLSPLVGPVIYSSAHFVALKPFRAPLAAARYYDDARKRLPRPCADGRRTVDADASVVVRARTVLDKWGLMRGPGHAAQHLICYGRH